MMFPAWWVSNVLKVVVKMVFKMVIMMVMMIVVVVKHVVWVVDDLVVNNLQQQLVSNVTEKRISGSYLWLGQLKDNHGTSEDQRQ